MVSLDIEINYTQTIDYNLAHPKCIGQKLIFLGEFSMRRWLQNDGSTMACLVVCHNP